MDCSGALFQTVWNVLTHRAPDYGIKDYDVFYFDPDTSWDAENDVIVRAKHMFADVDAAIEVRNQARVHLWFEAKFGAPYAPLISRNRRHRSVPYAQCASGYSSRAATATKFMRRAASTT